MDFDEVLGLKASAKDARRDGDWPTALDYLHEALEILHSIDPNDGVTESAASEIADTYGMIAGIERRWGLASADDSRASHLEASTRAYDNGFEYEQNLSIGNATTYNRINRIVARVLTRPTVLVHDDDPTIMISHELENTERLIKVQLEATRIKDPWAFCDLITIQLLRGVDSSIPTINELSGLRPPRFVYESMLDTVVPLAAVASTIRPELNSAVLHLTRSMNEAL